MSKATVTMLEPENPDDELDRSSGIVVLTDRIFETDCGPSPIRRVDVDWALWNVGIQR